jgi:TetR/AcrR family transcriptional regulator, transcriptional repressor for nem operon
MPREKDFSEAEVLNSAAELFTRHGYAGTSFSMLTEATGVGKQSLYNCYGDKQALYRATLEHTTQSFPAARWLVAKDLPGREVITRFFDEVLVDVCAKENPGCILTHGLLELADDEALAPSLREKWQATVAAIKATVERGQHDGSINRALGSGEIADILMNLLGGLRVANKARTSKARMQSIVKNTLVLLDPDPN